MTFEHENEAEELLFKRASQAIIPELISERDYKLPFFIDYETIDQGYCHGQLGERLFQLTA